MMRSIATALAVASLSSCVHTRVERPAAEPTPDVVLSQATEAWAAVETGREIGYVVRFEPDDASLRSWFSVRNQYSQELGMIDELGRAWRYRPHADEPELLGAGTVGEGAARILEASAVELNAVPIDAFGGPQ